jgi:hypothetical protein
MSPSVLEDVKKMIASVRTSRRTMFGGLILCVFSIVGFMVVKDMNDKLSVMTSSNSGYQKMTDSQASRITRLKHIVFDQLLRVLG